MKDFKDFKDFDNEQLVHEKTFIRKEYTVYLDEEVDSAEKYRLVSEVLRQANKEDTIIFIINTIGGYVSTFIQLYSFMINTKAKTIAEVYEASSVGSMIMFACDEINIQPFGIVMIHDFSAGVEGKMKEMQSRVKSGEDHRNEIFDTIYKYFLTKEEISDIKKGVDFYFGTEESKKRLENWIPIRKR